jgi:hypothetical protein
MRCADWFTLSDLDCEAGSPHASGYATVAMDWIYAATGDQWPGECETELRPTVTCSHRRGTCYCPTRWDRLDLTLWLQGPIVSIDQVTVDGTAVDPTHYRLDNRRWLSACAPDGIDSLLLPWPTQDLRRADGDPDTWTVTVTHGAIPPSPVVMAAKELACQLIRKAAGNDCELPDNATTISDNGITISMQVPTDGRVGIPRIDSILDLYGRNRTRRRMIDPTMYGAPRTAL